MNRTELQLLVECQYLLTRLRKLWARYTIDYEHKALVDNGGNILASWYEDIFYYLDQEDSKIRKNNTKEALYM